MVRWYLITWSDKKEIVSDIYALKRKELREMISAIDIIAISKITEKEARAFYKRFFETKKGLYRMPMFNNNFDVTASNKVDIDKGC